MLEDRNASAPFEDIDKTIEPRPGNVSFQDSSRYISKLVTANNKHKETIA